MKKTAYLVDPNGSVASFDLLEGVCWNLNVLPIDSLIDVITVEDLMVIST